MIVDAGGVVEKSRKGGNDRSDQHRRFVPLIKSENFVRVVTQYI